VALTLLCGPTLSPLLPLFPDQLDHELLVRTAWPHDCAFTSNGRSTHSLAYEASQVGMDGAIVGRTIDQLGLFFQGVPSTSG